MRYFTFPKIQNQSINKLFSLLNIKKQKYWFYLLEQNQDEKTKEWERGEHLRSKLTNSAFSSVW